MGLAVVEGLRRDMRRIEWFEGLNGLGLAVIEGLNGLTTRRGAKDVECEGELMWSEGGKVRGT